MAGKGATELWGSSKNDTDLQQNHKNDRVDNRMVVISDLKKGNKIFSGDKEVNNNACFTSLVRVFKYATFPPPMCKTWTNHLTLSCEESWNTTIYISSDYMVK